MNESNKSQSEINSFYIDKVLKINIAHLKKKRKLHAEQLGLPTPKHKCWDRSFISEPISTFDENVETQKLHMQIEKGKPEGVATDDGSELESGKDSNSFAEDSDSAMSVYGEPKLEPDYAKACIYERPSTSSGNWHRSSFTDSLNPSDNLTLVKAGTGKEKLTFLAGEQHPLHDGELQVYQNFEEHILELENHVDYMGTEYRVDSIEESADKELDDILHSNGVNPNVYVLSSGRWSVNQEAQSGTKKPTIDQEFEQYFSMLML